MLRVIHTLILVRCQVSFGVRSIILKFRNLAKCKREDTSGSGFVLSRGHGAVVVWVKFGRSLTHSQAVSRNDSSVSLQYVNSRGGGSLPILGFCATFIVGGIDVVVIELEDRVRYESFSSG